MSCDECRRTTKVHVQKGQMGSVHSPKRHDTGVLQEYRNEEQPTEIGSEVVTQKKKSPERRKRDLEGSEVQEIGRLRTGMRM